MILVRTPFRISFFGGGTDYPQWFRQEGGAVLSAAIGRYCWLLVDRLPPDHAGVKHLVSWTHREAVETVDDVLHPVAREAIRMYDVRLDNDPRRMPGWGVAMHHHGDLPARSGLGSSSAFAVCALAALARLEGRNPSAGDLAMEAIRLERDVLGDAGGWQDQVACACGGLNVVEFTRAGGFVVHPVRAQKRTMSVLAGRLVLFRVGGPRAGERVAATIDFERGKHALREMREMVERGREALVVGDLDAFGALLHETWRLKRSLGAGVTTPDVDAWYDRALDAGALGGKLCGAGGGGYLLVYANERAMDDVVEAMRPLRAVRFGFDWEGCRVVYES